MDNGNENNQYIDREDVMTFLKNNSILSAVLYTTKSVIAVLLLLTFSLCYVHAATMKMLPNENSQQMSMLQEMSTEIGISEVYCGDGYYCPDGYECCISSSTGYPCGCCSYGATACSCAYEECYYDDYPTCAENYLYQGDEDSLNTFRVFRDNVLQKSRKGQFYIKAYYKFSREVIKILSANPDLKNRALTLSDVFLSMLSNGAKEIKLSSEETEEVKAFLNELQKKASPALSHVIKRCKKDIDNQSWLNQMGITRISE